MYNHMGALKDDALDLAAGAVGVTAGAITARWVTNTLAGALPEFAGKDAVASLVPVAAGIAIQTYGASKLKKDTFARNAATGVAVGMVAYGLGRIVVGFLPASKDFTLQGLGEMDVYDYGMSGLGVGPGDVTAYMHGAPFTANEVTGFNNPTGAPVDVMSLNGAPVSIQQAGGIAAAF